MIELRTTDVVNSVEFPEGGRALAVDAARVILLLRCGSRLKPTKSKASGASGPRSLEAVTVGEKIVDSVFIGGMTLCCVAAAAALAYEVASDIMGGSIKSEPSNVKDVPARVQLK